MDGTRAEALANRLYEALAVGDWPAVRAVLHPSFEGRTAAGLPLGLGGVYQGADAMIRMFWGAIGKHYRARAEVGATTALSDGGLLVTGTYVGSARATGRPLAASFTHTLHFDDGRIVRLEQLTDTAAWHAALEGRCETIEYGVVDGVATICLNRPQERNAIDQCLADELLEVSLRCAGDRRVRAVVLCGNGADLTVGGDIRYFTSNGADGYGALFRQMTSPFHEAFRILDRLDAPIVTAAQGAVAGGGLGFVYAADIVFASPDAFFTTAFAAVGLSGDGGGTWYLPRLVGPRRAARMYLENLRLDAETAVEWGLVTEVVPDARERAQAKAAELAVGPTKAFGRMRRLLRASWTNTLSEHLLEEIENIAHTGATEDAAGAIAAFAAKRQPTFEGR